MFSNFLLVAGGGAAGALLRYGAGLLIGRHLFPFATFTINLVGSFLIGLLYGWAARQAINEKQFLLLATGLCGGFTTFSAFTVENLTLLQQQQYLLVLLYTCLSVIAGIAAAAAGFAITK